MASFADRDRTMQTQSRSASYVEFENLANDGTVHQVSAPSVLRKNFVRGVIHGLFLSTIFWILFAGVFMWLIQ
jgi:hypothetical protein